MRIFKNQSFKTINALFNSYRSKIITLLTLLIITTITESIGLALIPAALSLLTQSQLNYQLPSILQPYLDNFSSRYLGIWLLVIIFLSYIGKNIFNLISVGYSRKFCGMLRNSWRSMILDKYFNSEAKLIRSKKAGKLIDSLITQPTKAAKFLRTLIAALNQLILSLAMLILLFFSSWKLTLLIGLIFSIFALVGSIPLKRISTNLGKQDISASQKITAKVTEAINGILQIKIFNLEEKWRKQIIKTSELQSSINVKSAILAETPSLIGAFAIVLILTTSIVITFRNNQPNLPLIAMFLLVCQRLNNSVGNLMKNYTNLRNIKPSFDLVQKLIIDENKFKKDKREYISLKKINSLEIKNLSFSYPNQKEILKNINLEILKGQSCLIVGKSGSGKSTLINLICGLIYPKNGKIFINGFPLENIRNKKWLQKISYVSQDNYLFNDSIKNNLKLFNSKISDIEMIDACKKAAAHEFISNLSNGYETIVGERGLSLSGGQIQRLAIARALLKDGEVMIFDEATSALDRNNQELILNSLKKLSDKGKIIIFISHINQSIIEFDKRISLESIK